MKKVKQYYASLTASGAVQLIYRVREEFYNDGTIADILEYYSSNSIWMGSMEMEKALKTISPLTEEEAKYHINLWNTAYSL